MGGLHRRDEMADRAGAVLVAALVVGAAAIVMTLITVVVVAWDEDDDPGPTAPVDQATVPAWPELTEFVTSEVVQFSGGPAGLSAQYAFTTLDKAQRTYGTRPDHDPERAAILVVVDGEAPGALQRADGRRLPEIVMLSGRYLVLVFDVEDPARVLAVHLSDERPDLADVAPVRSAIVPQGPARSSPMSTSGTPAP